MDIKVISVNVGKALLVSALFMFLSLVVSLSGGMDEAFSSLLISFLITLTVGAFPFIFVRKTSCEQIKACSASHRSYVYDVLAEFRISRKSSEKVLDSVHRWCFEVYSAVRLYHADIVCNYIIVYS